MTQVPQLKLGKVDELEILAMVMAPLPSSFRLTHNAGRPDITYPTHPDITYPTHPIPQDSTPHSPHPTPRAHGRASILPLKSTTGGKK
jgi:hypothetical protein